MGKQSARLYYGGKDHKDIYFQGNYHRAMYKGDELMWMKLSGEKYIPIMRRKSSGESGIYIYYPESKSIEKVLEREDISESTVDGMFRFNGTFLMTLDMKSISRDGKTFLSYDYNEIFNIGHGVVGGGVGLYKYLLSDEGEILKTLKMPLQSLVYEGIRSVEYFKNYYFFRGAGSRRHNLIIIRNDGYALPEVSFLRGVILYYANVNGAHTFIVGHDGHLNIYQSHNLSEWTYWGTGISVYEDFIYHEPLSCVYDGEKYLLYVYVRNAAGRRLTLLYETYDFISFLNIPLPAYITLNGIKEDSTRYLVTDEERYFENLPDVDLVLAYNRHILFDPSMVGESSTLLYNNGIKIRPRTIFTGTIYIDNLYLQDSENNMIIDFWED